MKRTISGLAIFFMMGHCRGQVFQNANTGYITAGTYTAEFADVFSFTANQAALAGQKISSAGLYTEKRFLLSDLSTYLVALGLVTPAGNFGCKMNYAGAGLYNEMQLGLAHARKLGRNIDIGVQFNYTHIHITGYGAASAIGFEIGSLFYINKLLHAGIHISNPVGGKFGKDQQEKLPAVYTMGFGYEPSDKVLVNVEIIKEENQPVNVNAGIYYKLLPQLFAKTGITTATSSPWLGFGFLWKTYRLDLCATYHLQLGISPGLLLVFDFKNHLKNEQ